MGGNCTDEIIVPPDLQRWLLGWEPPYCRIYRIWYEHDRHGLWLYSDLRGPGERYLCGCTGAELTRMCRPLGVLVYQRNLGFDSRGRRL